MLVEFSREFSPMKVSAVLAFGDKLGGGAARIRGEGSLVLAFQSTRDPDILSIHLRKVSVDLETFEIQLPNQESVRIKGLSMKPGDFDIEGFRGSLRRSTGEASLEFTFVLDPENIPVLTKLGIFRPVKVTAVEKGRIDVATGLLETHAAPFTLPRPLDAITVHGGQFSRCEVDAKLCVATAEGCANAQERRLCYDEVWICPGEEACLYWEVGGSATSASITPDIGSVSVGSDTKNVSPATDTDYKLTASDNDCSQSRTVTVRVVEPGDRRILSASPHVELCLWSVRVPVETTSPHIRITSIRTVTCGFSGSIWPSWLCHKTDPDGTVWDFGVGLVASSPGAIPVVGLWEFVPEGAVCTTGQRENACFEITMRC